MGKGKMKKPCGLIVLIILVFSLFGGLAVRPADASIILTEQQITSNNASQENPDIFEYGPRNYTIVWQDNRNGNWDIYMYNPWQPGEVCITNSSANQIKPKIYGDTIVYQDDRNNNWDIYIYDLNSKVETQITNSTASQSNPVIDGKYIVYQDNRRGQLDIYMYDLTNQSERQVTVQDNNYNPVISGNNIAFVTDVMGAGYFGNPIPYIWIQFYYIPSGQKRVIDSEPLSDGNLADPAIDGNNIVWARMYKEWDIFLYNVMNDINNGMWHTTSYAQHQHPDIYGRYIVNTDGRNGNLDIYMSDYVAGQEYRVTNNNATQNNPRISAEYGNYIVYMDNRNGNWDIYLTFFGYGVGSVGGGQSPIPSSSNGAAINWANQGLLIIMISAVIIAIIAVVVAGAFLAMNKRNSKKSKNVNI
jgi:beta propeller repeat protein